MFEATGESKERKMEMERERMWSRTSVGHVGECRLYW